MKTSLRSLFVISAAALAAPFMVFSASAQEEDFSASELNAQQLDAFLAEMDPTYEGEGDIADDFDAELDEGFSDSDDPVSDETEPFDPEPEMNE